MPQRQFVFVGFKSLITLGDIVEEVVDVFLRYLHYAYNLESLIMIRSVTSPKRLT